MNIEARAAFIVAQAACANARIAGMQAENQWRLGLGQTVLYGEEAFEKVMTEFMIGHNDVIEYLRD